MLDLDQIRRLDRLSPRIRAALFAVAGALVVVVVIPAIIPHEAPGGVVLQGAELGAVNGLMALGLVLTYRSTRIINFSYAAMGALAATFGVMLDLVDHWNWFLCILVSLGIGAVLGAATEILVVRRLFNSPRMILTVATIGLASGFGGIQALVPAGWEGPTSLEGSRHRCRRPTWSCTPSSSTATTS